MQREAWDEGTSFGLTAIRNTLEAFTRPLSSPTDTITALSVIAMVLLLVVLFRRKPTRPMMAYTFVVLALMILPATVTLKYHLDAGAIKPYVGVGPSVFFYFDEKPGATAKALGATSLKMDNKLGVALQAGVDVPINDAGMGISLDAKKYFMKPTTHFYTAGGVEALSTTHKLDPWVISAGVYARF